MDAPDAAVELRIQLTGRPARICHVRGTRTSELLNLSAICVKVIDRAQGVGRGAHSQRRGVRVPPSAAGTAALPTAAVRPPGTAPHTASCGATVRQEGRRVSRRAARPRRYPPTRALAAAAALRRCSRCRSRRAPPRSRHRAATAPHSSAAAAPALCPPRPRCGILSPPRRCCRAESRCARWSSCDAPLAHLRRRRHVSARSTGTCPLRSWVGLGRAPKPVRRTTAGKFGRSCASPSGQVSLSSNQSRKCGQRGERPRLRGNARAAGVSRSLPV